MKALKAIWAKRQVPRLAKELEYRIHTKALLEKRLRKEERIIKALQLTILQKKAG